MQYKMTILEEEFKIKHIVTIHYFEYDSKFSFKGESHDFWELVYVDKGEIEVKADKKIYRLNQGDMIFHKPKEFHSLSANGIVSPSLVIISFSCSSKAMKFFNHKILRVENSEKNILAMIVKEAIRVFEDASLKDPYSYRLNKLSTPYFGSEQLIKIYIEQLLISLYRNNNITNKSNNSSIIKDRLDLNIVDDVIEFLKDNLGKNITFSDVIKYANISATGLKTIFKSRLGMGVIKYYNVLKIERAKLIIRENNYNFSQISTLLGYDSIHYFSKQFKSITGMSPTEYAKSVKPLIS